ncbi:MAG: PIG-L family deacetylase [Anaerolineales bacterium]|nr:PIG-L family deacetylase [Anaerolineales bacterium]
MDMKWIFLSPHLDDVVFSCGGLVWELSQTGHEVEIWTICAGDPPQESLSPFAESLHRNWKLGLDAVQIRRQEDQKACQILGAAPRYFPVLDCIYRKSSAGKFYYDSEGGIFGGFNPGEAELINEVSSHLVARLPDPARIISPLGIGNHVDHELVRKAANRLPMLLYYYADYPYARENDGAEILKFMEGSAEWQCESFPVSEIGLEKWIQAAWAFGSQISTFWENELVLGEEIRNFSRSLGGMKLWKAVEEN